MFSFLMDTMFSLHKPQKSSCFFFRTAEAQPVDSLFLLFGRLCFVRELYSVVFCYSVLFCAHTLRMVGIVIRRLLDERFISFFYESDFRIAVLFQKGVYLSRIISRHTCPPYHVFGFPRLFVFFFVSFISFASRLDQILYPPQNINIVSIRYYYFTRFDLRSQALPIRKTLSAA